jgi:ribosome modulation factor
MEDRAKIDDAWLEGRKAGLEGGDRASNPYVGKNSDLANAWDQGWQEGSGYLAR